MSKNDNSSEQVTGPPPAYLDPKKKMNERKHIVEFIDQIKANKEAYSVFYEQAERRGIVGVAPQRKF